MTEVRSVKVPAFESHDRTFPATNVFIGRSDVGETYEVWLSDGTTIGYLRKGSYTYSPPTHKGSRIARYHRKIPEWQADPTERYGLAYRGGREEPRKRALAYLIAVHAGVEHPHSIYFKEKS